MQLSVPQRGVADSGSFPVEPAEVARWLNGLRPLASESDAREVYRGLKHSNRLHNPPERRRAVLGCFLPVLAELRDQLSELTRAQPLPLAREFSRGATLVEALLREEAFAFKILLADGETPDPDDARRAMRALARQAEVAVHGYRRVPATLLGDAHGLYALAESGGLIGAPGEGTAPTFLDHYRLVLLLAIVDTRQVRAAQLPLALELLRETANTLVLRRLTRDAPRGRRYLGVHLESGAAPEPLASLLVEDPAALRVFDIDTPLAHLERAIARARPAREEVSTPGPPTLERQTLTRLRAALAGERGRRAARTITRLPQPAVFGQREITAHLLLEPEARSEVMRWTLTNRSAQGLCLHHPSCPAGSVQVGELVAVDGSPERRDSTLLGTVRWVHADGEARVTLGVEYLARGVLPVTLVRAEGDSPVTENALIIACKVQRATVQTILLPPGLYESGEQLIATRGERSRRLGLRTSLQTNGLFGHFLIE